MEKMEDYKFSGLSSNQRREKILSLLRLSEHPFTTQLTLSTDDHFFKEIVLARYSEIWGPDLAAAFGSVEKLDLRYTDMENYRYLAAFLRFFANSLVELRLEGVRLNGGGNFDSDESELCVVMAEMGRLERLYINDKELKGAILTGLSPSLIELRFDECTALYEYYLLEMAARCQNLERLRLLNVSVTLPTFRQFCLLPRLRMLRLRLNRLTRLDDDWVQCILANHSIDVVLFEGNVGCKESEIHADPWKIKLDYDDVDEGFGIMYFVESVWVTNPRVSPTYIRDNGNFFYAMF